MRKGELKKEFYFTSDVFKEVSKRLSISEVLVKEVFNDYVNDLKQHILETDFLAYSMSPLGNLTINKKELDKKTNSYLRKLYRAKTKKEKQEIQGYLDNFKMRQKRMRIEVEKFDHVYPDQISKTYLNKEKNAMLKPSKYEATYYNNSLKLVESSSLQNEYAYNWYKRNNKPINH